MALFRCGAANAAINACDGFSVVNAPGAGNYVTKLSNGVMSTTNVNANTTDTTDNVSFAFENNNTLKVTALTSGLYIYGTDTSYTIGQLNANTTESIAVGTLRTMFMYKLA